MPTLSARTTRAIQETLAGQRRGIRAVLPFAGPAVIASIAYMDPGNFATNIQAGAKFGYALLWVVLLANLVATLFQSLSAKLGIVTGKNLAEMCRDHFPRQLTIPMWLASEIAAMATDLAEFLGGAIGLSLLFDLPLLAGMTVTAIITYSILLFDKHGFRPLELIIGALVVTIGLCYLAEILMAPIAWSEAARHLLIPSMPNPEALTIAVGIVGATVMPHALYLHSGLTQSRVPARSDAERHIMLRYNNREVIGALAVAGLVNIAMVMMAASAFYPNHQEVASIETAYHTLKPLLGAASASVFLISLIASGISSSAVGTMAGQMIMQGFVGFRIPVWLRRLVTMLPAFAIVGYGVDATQALILSQVILSFALPIPMIALTLFTRNRHIMGRFANRRLTDIAAITGTIGILILNTILLLQTFGLPIPGFNE